MLIIGSLGRHSIVLRLSIHSLSKRAIASTLAIAAKLVHVVSIVWAAIVRMAAVGIATGVTLLSTMLLLHMLALSSRSSRLLATEGWVWCVMSAVLRIVVSALAVLLLALCKGSILRAGAECAAGTLLSRTSLLLAGSALLSVASIILLIALLRCEVLRTIVIC